MITRREVLIGTSAALTATLMNTASAQQRANITVLYDAFGKQSDLKRGWGYSAFIEYAGRRILFDTGARTADFAYNTKALGIDLKQLDFVVLTHRHNDHTAGLSYVIQENPAVTVHAPFEPAQFSTPIPGPLMNLIKRHVVSVPDDMRYFGGDVPADLTPQPPWPAQFSPIGQPKEVLPGVHLFATQSDKPGFREMNEISLLLKTPKGSVLAVGCSHSGIEKILDTATKIDPKIYAIYGGFHLVDMPDGEVTAMIMRFKDQWKIERMGAGHCTGEFAFSEMQRIFGASFEHAGVGAKLVLPS